MKYEYIILTIALLSSLVGVVIKRVRCRCGCGCLSCAMATPRVSPENPQHTQSNQASISMLHQLMAGLSPRSKKRVIESMAIP